MGGWQNSDRRDHLPSNWRQLRTQRFRLDGWQCTARDPNTGERCPEPAEECDHAGDRDDHRLDSLRSLCSWHHGKKSAREGAKAAYRAKQKRADRFNRTEGHPGSL